MNETAYRVAVVSLLVGIGATVSGGGPALEVAIYAAAAIAVVIGLASLERKTSARK